MNSVLYSYLLLGQNYSTCSSVACILLRRKVMQNEWCLYCNVQCEGVRCISSQKPIYIYNKMIIIPCSTRLLVMDPSFAVCRQKSGLHYDADMIQAILLIVLFSEFFNEAVVGAGLGRLRTEDAVWMLCNGAQTPGNATSNYFLTPAAWGGLARAALSICWLELQAAVPRIACTHHYLKQKKTLIGVGRAAAARMEKWNETISEHRGNELTAVLVCPDHNISHFSPQRTFLVPPAARRRRSSNDSLIKFWHWLVTASLV